ncbi:SDR family NAD(P)-dependent oxidoreductase [Stutzerimonas stutzeri]|uniref:SDR family NAD(P)-dependent oxidoreductase n=1 Tax=Stutzerimonas stutzeri TaxID=316 RepID=UPI00190F22D8
MARVKDRCAASEFSNRTAIVTGAGTDLGEAIAERLSAAGANVVLANRHLEPARDGAARLDPTGERTLAIATWRGALRREQCGHYRSVWNIRLGAGYRHVA